MISVLVATYNHWIPCWLSHQNPHCEQWLPCTRPSGHWGPVWRQKVEDDRDTCLTHRVIGDYQAGERLSPPITTKSDGIKPHYREQWNTNQLWLIRGRALYVSAQGLLAHWADSRQQKWPIFTLRQIHDQTSKRLFSVVMTMCRVRRQQAWKTRSPAAAISNMFTAWFLIRVCKDEPIWDTARYSICVFKCQFGFKASV